jgi:hypothetical protein
MGNYLYNSVARPPIPDWNGDTHPYVYITSHPLGNYMCNARNIQYGTDEYGYNIGIIDGWCYNFMPGKHTEWEKTRSTEQTGLTTALEDIVWANFDVLNEDGSIYLPASYPTDAETGETITTYGLHHFPVTETDHNARIMGWIVGKRLAAMRGKA